MKKKICMLVLALCMTASFTACGSKEDTKSSAEAKNEDTKEDVKEEETQERKEDSEEMTEDTRIVSVAADEMEKYIKLGEYKGLDVQEDVQEVTDADVETQIETNLSQNPVEVTDENAEVKEGDVVNIDYEGKKDGVAFEGGTA